MALSKEQILEIINVAVHAPSGENAQPWKFELGDNVLNIWNTPESDTSIYNNKQRGAHVAHGALIENISIIAKHHLHDIQVKNFPDTTEPDLIFQISFLESLLSDSENEELYRSISIRVTNRKQYYEEKLSADLKTALINIKKSFGINFYFTEDAHLKSIVSTAASINEKLLFEIPEMNKFFFSHIRWSDAEEKIDPRGFYVKTLELEPPQLGVMKLLRNKIIFTILSKFGIGKIIARDNARRYMSASCVCVITSPDTSPAMLINVGRFLQHIWLTVTKMKCSLQPMSGLFFLYHALDDNNNVIFSPSKKNEISNAYETIKLSMKIPKNEKMIMMFRIGKSDQPSAKSKRIPPIIINRNEQRI